MRFRFALGLAAVLIIAAGSVLTALIVRSNEIDHFHKVQSDEALRSARQAQTVALLSVGELDTAAAFFQAEGHFDRHQFEIVGNSLLQGGALTATAYLQQVRRSERAEFERSRGYPIIDRGGDGRSMPYTADYVFLRKG